MYIHISRTNELPRITVLISDWLKIAYWQRGERSRRQFEEVFQSHVAINTHSYVKLWHELKVGIEFRSCLYRTQYCIKHPGYITQLLRRVYYSYKPGEVTTLLDNFLLEYLS